VDLDAVRTFVAADAGRFQEAAATFSITGRPSPSVSPPWRRTSGYGCSPAPRAERGSPSTGRRSCPSATALFLVASDALSSPLVLTTMLAGAVAGGFGGAHLARRLPPRLLRGAVLTTAVTMTVLYFLRG
jgi:hypothetical protein